MFLFLDEYARTWNIWIGQWNFILSGVSSVHLDSAERGHFNKNATLDMRFGRTEVKISQYLNELRKRN